MMGAGNSRLPAKSDVAVRCEQPQMWNVFSGAKPLKATDE
jgi:hypothetical protein